MQRAASCARFCMVCSRGREHGGSVIEAVDMNHVAAQVVDIGESVVGREGREVGVRTFLAVFVGAVDGVMLCPDSGAEFAVVDKKAGSAAAAVVG